MRWLKHAWIPGVALVALGISLPWLVAQPVVQNTVTGLECWNAGQGPGGPSTGALCAALMRNGTALTIFTGSGAVATIANQNQSTLMWHSTAPTTWTITLPNPAFDGEILTVGTDTTLTTMVTVQTTNTPQSQVTLAPTYSAQTLSAGTSVEWQFNLASLTWYRFR